jgi:hypothetical protein
MIILTHTWLHVVMARLASVEGDTWDRTCKMIHEFIADI